MSKQRTLFTAISIILMAVAYTLYTNDIPIFKKPSSPLILNTNKESGDNNEQTPLQNKSVVPLFHEILDSKSPPYGHSKLRVDFNNSEDAQQAQDAIDTAYINGNDELAKDLEYKLYRQCSNPDILVPPGAKNTEWLLVKIREYCSSYTPTLSYEDARKHGTLSSEQLEKKKALKHKLKQTDDNEKIKVIVNAVINASTRDEIYRVLSLWMQILESNPRASLSQLKYPYVFLLYNYPDIYFASFDLYGCYKFGGCETNQSHSLFMCSLAGQCQPGWSVFDYYENNLTSNEMENVAIILQYIFDQQAAR